MTIPPVHRSTGYAYTRAEYDAVMADRDRPLTDKPTGWHSAPKRDMDASASATFTDTSAIPIPERRTRPAPSLLPSCGQPHGYSAHQRRYEPPCDACRQAKNEITRRQYAERRASTAPMDTTATPAVGTHHDTPRRSETKSRPSRGRIVPQRTENPK